MENDKVESRHGFSDGGVVPDRLASNFPLIPSRGECRVPISVRSLRDDCAMLALKTILADDASLAIGTPDEIDELADKCYAVADAMMKARR